MRRALEKGKEERKENNEVWERQQKVGEGAPGRQ